MATFPTSEIRAHTKTIHNVTETLHRIADALLLTGNASLSNTLENHANMLEDSTQDMLRTIDEWLNAELLEAYGTVGATLSTMINALEQKP
jgi:hypothetical protein